MIAEILLDRQHKRSTPEICSELGITTRELRAQVRRERIAGAPICAETDSESSGYYLGDERDIERNRRTLARKANEIRKVWRCMGETAQRLRDEVK